MSEPTERPTSATRPVRNERRARAVLDYRIEADGYLRCDDDEEFTHFDPSDPQIVELNGEYTADELEAIAWWMRKYA